MADHKKKGPTVPLAAMEMALAQLKAKHEKELATAKAAAPATQVEPKLKAKRNGEPYNNVPGSKRDRRFQRQLDKVLAGVQSGKLRGEYEVIGQSTIRNYLKAHNLACGSEHAGTFQSCLALKSTLFSGSTSDRSAGMW